MSIRREGNGRRPWRCRYYDAEGVERLRSFPTKKLAEEFDRAERERKSRILSGLPERTDPISYDDLSQLFLDGYTAESKDWLERMLRHSRDRFGQAKVHLIRPEQIARWLAELDLSPKTKGHILTAMRQVCNAGIEWGYLVLSPARPAAVKAPRGSSLATAVRPLESWAEVLAVADAAGSYGPLIRFVCSTGLRPNEWSKLRPEDIDFAAKILRVPGTKTEAAARTVTLSKPSISALAAAPAYLFNRALVFTTPHGKKIDTKQWGQKVWRPALAAAGLDDRPSYQMRHTFATLALAQGCTLEWVGKELGHRDIGVTRKHYARFTKVVDDRMRALLDRMEDDVGNRHTDARG